VIAWVGVCHRHHRLPMVRPGRFQSRLPRHGGLVAVTTVVVSWPPPLPLSSCHHRRPLPSSPSPLWLWSSCRCIVVMVGPWLGWPRVFRQGGLKARRAWGAQFTCSRGTLVCCPVVADVIVVGPWLRGRGRAPPSARRVEDGRAWQAAVASGP